MYLLGLDIGSSSVKAALVRAADGAQIQIAQSPESAEMPIRAPIPGRAEQDPETWWQHACLAIQQVLARTNIPANHITGIGIAYQMHGLVALNAARQPVRPAIIWCDSRAVETGDAAFQTLGAARCLPSLLNSPGNFTAAKLRWVMEHEPDTYEQIHKIMLPGDYIAFRLTGEIATTVTGLSEGMWWDFQAHAPAQFLLDHWGMRRDLLPDLAPVTGIQGRVGKEAAAATGLATGTPVCYRAGDQPNNALALNVLKPGEAAATGGTSGVVFAVADQPVFDAAARVNCFAHVNHQPDSPRIGTLLCINGAGIQYGWLRKYLNPAGNSYEDMEQLAASVPVGADGLCILPFGNGAERMLQHANPGAQALYWDFNRQSPAHWYRAGLEGVAFAFVYGMAILRELHIDIGVVRVGNDNLFRSAVFSKTIATLADCRIDVLETSGAFGAARAAGVATGAFDSLDQAVENTRRVIVWEPQAENAPYLDAFYRWKNALETALEKSPGARQ
jgi:xylulokinase